MSGADEATLSQDISQDNWVQPRRISRVTALRFGIVSDIQLVGNAGPYLIDMLVRDIDEPDRVGVSGMVISKGDESEPAADLNLQVVNGLGDPIMSSMTTNEFGEFRMLVPRRDTTGLRLGRNVDAPCLLLWEDEA